MEINYKNSYTILNSSSNTGARTGTIRTNHGLVRTPVFLPVASQGCVKTLTPDDLEEIGTDIILCNVYHLYLRPGIKIIGEIGGLHKFMRWEHAILTDSGGYQVFSLSPFCKLSDDGVTFRSHIDGSEHYFSPEDVIEYQEKLGVDILMTLDECSSLDFSKERVREAMQRTHKWALRCKKTLKDDNRLLYSIIQGGLYPDLRKESVQELCNLSFSGYAIGGLSLGESKELMWSIVDITTELLPWDKPRYLMGVGSPEDIILGISKGIDIFDSALPTRVARNGALFTRNGRINLFKATHKLKEEPIDSNCDCYTCCNFSVAYLHHLFKSGELLAYRLATIHNLRFIVKLINEIRNAIEKDNYLKYMDDFISCYKITDEFERISQKRKWLISRGSNSDTWKEIKSQKSDG